MKLKSDCYICQILYFSHIQVYVKPPRIMMMHICYGEA